MMTLLLIALAATPQRDGPAPVVMRGADVVEWILANVPPDGVVLFRGHTDGPMEFVPGMIAPRLLVREASCPAPLREYHGRPLACRDEAGERRAVVVVGGECELHLEVR